MYLLNNENIDNTFHISPEALAKFNGFKTSYEHREIDLRSPVIFHGIECYGEFTFVNWKLYRVKLTPKPESVEYENWDRWPDQNFEKAIRDVFEPILTKAYGEKKKIKEDLSRHQSKFDDGYRWHDGDFEISMHKTCYDKPTVQGGEIIIKKTKEGWK